VFLFPLALGVLGAVFTTHKLDQMKMIRGYEPGAVRLRVSVIKKWRDTVNDAYWVAWNDSAASKLGRQRMNLPRPLWKSFETGDTIEVTYLAGSRAAYHRNGIFASAGNFKFDRKVLAVEDLLIILSAVAIVTGAAMIFLEGRKRMRSSGEK